MANLKGMVIGIVGLFLLAALAPSAITAISSANVTAWASTDQTLWLIIPTMAIIGFVLMVLKPALED